MARFLTRVRVSLPDNERANSDREHDQNAEAGARYVRLQQRQVVAEIIPEPAEDDRPDHAANRVVRHELGGRHAGCAGDYGRPGAQNRDEASEENRLGAVLLETRVGAIDVGLPNSDVAAVVGDQRQTALDPNPVAKYAADDSGGRGKGDDDVNGDMTERRVGGGRYQRDLPWKGNADAFQQDQ